MNQSQILLLRTVFGATITIILGLVSGIMSLGPIFFAVTVFRNIKYYGSDIYGTDTLLIGYFYGIGMSLILSMTIAIFNSLILKKCKVKNTEKKSFIILYILSILSGFLATNILL